MIENKLIQKMVKHVLNPNKKKFIDKNIMHPEREWFLSLLAGILICVTGAWWSITTYITYNHIDVQNKEIESPVVYRANMVKEVINDFSNRETTYNDLLSELKKQNPAVATVVSVATSTDVLIENEVASSSTEIRNDRSTEVPLPEYQTDPEASVSTGVEESNLIDVE